MIAKACSLGLRTRSRLVAWVRTQDAHNQALLGPGSRLGESGRIINIAGDKRRIQVGGSSYVNGELLTFAHSGSIQVGDWFYIGPGSTVWSSSNEGISIGDRVLISMGVHIHDTNSHSLDPEKRFLQTKAILQKGHPSANVGIKAKPIVIHDDVWIGFGATVMKGVTIGPRAVIGARAIVTEDVPMDGFVPSP